MARWRCKYCGTSVVTVNRPISGTNGTYCPARGGGFTNGKPHVWVSDDCFITTAVCQTLGAPDDCKELTMIRNFRDSRLRPFMKDGELLVKEYYRIGPMIVEAINKDADASSIYTQLWNDRLKLCCEQIEQKNWEQAKLIYIKMVRELCEKYNIEVDPTIKESYFF